jgi:hypothetical protein
LELPNHGHLEIEDFKLTHYPPGKSDLKKDREREPRGSSIARPPASNIMQSIFSLLRFSLKTAVKSVGERQGAVSMAL